MDINVNIKVDLAPQLLAMLQSVFSVLMQPAVTAPSTNPSVGKLKKAEKAADKTQDPEPDPIVETEPSEKKEQSSGEKITVEMIRALLPEKKQKVGTEKVKALLTKYNVPNVTSLPQDKYSEFYQELKNLAA